MMRSTRRFGSPRTRHARFVCVLSLLSVAALILSSYALGQTTVPGGTYSSNVTWGPSGSPYVLTGNLTIAAGAVLTIQAGTVVKMSGQTRTITVNGQLLAQGNSANAVVFTSVQDDAADGVDSGADGPTTGAPGQWYQIRLSANSSYPSNFDYVDMRFGGWGSADWGYGAIAVVGGTHVLSHSRLHHNQRSGVTVSSSGNVVISKTRLDHNANGVSVVGAAVSLMDSVVDHNSSNGVYFSFAQSPATQSLVQHARISSNGTRGIYLDVNSAVPGSLAPAAHFNNIFANGTPDANGIPPLQANVVQSQNRTDIDWSSNYWGTWGPGKNPVNANPCAAAGPNENYYHLVYAPYAENSGLSTPPPGPVSSKTLYSSTPSPGYFCGSDKIDTYPFSQVPYESQYISPLTRSQEISLSSDLRPFLKYDSDERWTPLLLDSFFEEVDGDEGAHKFCPDPGSSENCTPLPSLAYFAALGNTTPEGHLNINNTSGNQYKSLYVVNGICSPAWSGLRECGDSARSALYYNLTTLESADGYQTARSYWDYWWFYRFNDASSTEFDHEGDWEGMTVVTPAALNPDIGATDQILYVIYAQHNGAYRQLPGTYSVDLGTHAVGYPANGTHATYSVTCSSFCFNDNNLPEGSHDGSNAWTLNSSCAWCAVPLPEMYESPLLGPSAADWNALQVRWGSTENGISNGTESPTAPGQQARYQAPWSAGGSAAPPPTARSLATVTGEQRCGSWFGGDVVALLCDQRAVRRASIAGLVGGRNKGIYRLRLEQAGARAGSTFGLAQAVGRPLQNGEVFKIRGRVPAGVLLRLRVALSHRRARAVTFELPRLRRGGTFTLHVRGSRKSPLFLLTVNRHGVALRGLAEPRA